MGLGRFNRSFYRAVAGGGRGLVWARLCAYEPHFVNIRKNLFEVTLLFALDGFSVGLCSIGTMSVVTCGVGFLGRFRSHERRI